jgi:AcrR family transcriptional regulator
MGRPLFDEAGFLEAARILASEHGPGAVTVDSVTQRMKAPKGSFYHRFSSRDVLLGRLWLKLVLAYQEGFVAAIQAGAGLEAALHMPRWARAHLDDARILLLHSRHDFVQGDWPAELRRGVRDQARDTFGRAGPRQVRCARFVLAEVPGAAIKGHLEQGEAPPPIVDELITKTYYAIVESGRQQPFPAIG